MDVDPKPLEDDKPSAAPMGSEEPTSPEPMMPSDDMSMDSPQPTGEPSPTIATALDQDAAEDKEPQTAPLVMSSPAPVAKKSHKNLMIIIIVGVALLIIAALAWYVFYGGPMSKSTASSTAKTTPQSTVTPATATANSTTINAAVDSLTSNATSEATLTETDDSSNATAASMSAANVGDSINENNF